MLVTFCLAQETENALASHPAAAKGNVSAFRSFPYPFNSEPSVASP
jgi:hypothetical protein